MRRFAASPEDARSIQRVADGHIWANTEPMRFLVDLVSKVPSLRVLNALGRQLLTPREEQVVALVAEGDALAQAAHLSAQFFWEDAGDLAEVNLQSHVSGLEPLQEGTLVRDGRVVRRYYYRVVHGYR